ncbi:unnamed protein product [Calypogeia fissa]
MELVRDVAIKNHPWPYDLEVPEPDESAERRGEERRGEGIADPHLVGLPSLATAAAHLAAQDLEAVSTKQEAPMSTPQKKSGGP